MAGKTNAFEYNLVKLIFNGTGISSLCTSAGTTDLWIGLHTADPTDAGSTAAEGGYTQYTRIATDRSTAATGWSVTSGSSKAGASPVGNVDFPQNTTTSTGTFSYFTVNHSSDSAGSAAYYTGTLSPTINFSQNVTPRITTSSSITEG